jgi:hypothetical protein
MRVFICVPVRLGVNFALYSFTTAVQASFLKPLSARFPRCACFRNAFRRNLSLVSSHSAFSSWLDIRKIKARCGTKARCFIVMSVSFPWVLQVLVVVVRGWLWWWSLCGSQSGGGRFYFFRIVRTSVDRCPWNHDYDATKQSWSPRNHILVATMI